MKVFSRRATESDCEVLELLEIEARTNFALFRGGLRLASDLKVVGENWFTQVADTKTIVFVGGTSQTVLGYLLARIGLSSLGKIATIEQVFVTRDARNMGIGDALVSSIIDWAKSQSFVALDALALPGDRETKNLFERSGLVARLIVATTDLSN